MTTPKEAVEAARAFAPLPESMRAGPVANAMHEESVKAFAEFIAPYMRAHTVRELREEAEKQDELEAKHYATSMGDCYSQRGLALHRLADRIEREEE